MPPADCSARRHSRASLRYLSSLKRCWSLMITLWDLPLPVTASHKVCDSGFMHDAKWAKGALASQQSLKSVQGT